MKKSLNGASRRGRRPNDEEISIWNAFLRKRGWRDGASEELAESKKEADFADREDIQRKLIGMTPKKEEHLERLSRVKFKHSTEPNRSSTLVLN